jgi:hypothetical protein
VEKTASYTIDFDIDQSNVGKNIFLDLGHVKQYCYRHCYGKELGTLWKSPYQNWTLENANQGR